MVTNKIFLNFSDSNAYKMANKASDLIWETVANRNSFEKNTLGSQYVRCVDSIGANLAEGFGRFHKKDKEKFYYNARGSVYEALHWTDKAFKRGLVSEMQHKRLMDLLSILPREINWLIKITEEKLTV